MEDEATQYPLTAQATSEDVYMDDAMERSDDFETSLILREPFDQMMSTGIIVGKVDTYFFKAFRGIPGH